MVINWINAFLGRGAKKNLKQYKRILVTINALSEEYAKLSDKELQQNTHSLKAAFKEGASPDDIVVKAFATIREASKRVLGMYPFDVQILGGLVLYEGKVAEMKTGEGKTLVAILPSYAKVIMNQKVHIVTVNDFLASRDAEWMGQVFEFLGVSVGVVTSTSKPSERAEAYTKDIVYATNTEIVFDFLRDNLAMSAEEMVQKGHDFVLVDEADSVLIDEARMPISISGEPRAVDDMLLKINGIVKNLNPELFEHDMQSGRIVLNDGGIDAIEFAFKHAGLINPQGGLYDADNNIVLHYLNQSLKAHFTMKKEVEYIVKENEVVLIDEFSGRMLVGRRYSGGLHQALEAKEGLKIQPESITLSSITYKNYFNQYAVISGMSGTASTEVNEFKDNYGLEVVEIPTHLPIARIDEVDSIYTTRKQKDEVILQWIQEAHAKGQPVLIGTLSIEQSEYYANLLKQAKLPFNILNARYHEQEAMIIAQAGCLKAITIATSMAGRGTDIQLGGNLMMRLKALRAEGKTEAEVSELAVEIAKSIEAEKQAVIALGGLLVIGSERSDTRRVDNQLKGRSGRQGDVGRTKFFLSFEDELMRKMGAQQLTKFHSMFGTSNEDLYHPLIAKRVISVQRLIESYNYDVRKSLLKYDDAINVQRNTFFAKRKEIIATTDFTPYLQDIVLHLLDQRLQAEHYAILPEQWNMEAIQEALASFGIKNPKALLNDSISEIDEFKEVVAKEVVGMIETRLSRLPQSIQLSLLRQVIVRMHDTGWREHLMLVDTLSQSVSLRGYGQKNPINEFQRELFNSFIYMMDSIYERVVHQLMQVDVDKILESIQEANELVVEAPQPPKIPSRNDLCYCGSGKKYKHCHGEIK